MVQVKRSVSKRRRSLVVPTLAFAVFIFLLVLQGSRLQKLQDAKLQGAKKNDKDPNAIGLVNFSKRIRAGSSITKTTLSSYNGETVTLRSALMPAVGYGTCCRPSAKGEAIYRSTLLYLKNGGRLIDTAMSYGNHAEIGKAIRESGLSRHEIWITSKIDVNRIKGKEALKKTVKAVKDTLRELNVGDYMDLFLIHSQKLGKEETIQIWKGLIDAQKLGIVRAIGVSNFNQREILDLLEATGVMPELNQIQFHPWTTPEWKALVKWQNQNDIATTAYTSLGGSRFHRSKTNTKGWPTILTELASKYSVTEAQVLLRWALLQNVAVIPGATSEEHIRENLNVPKFDLSEKDSMELEKAGAPKAWWDPKRGPVKYLAEEAGKAWEGIHTVHN